MGTRSDLRGFLKQSQYLNSAAPATNENEIGGGSRSSRKECEEVVKYMSKLPGYLQAGDEERLLQSNVLNVGVLDWSRLEKWKQQHGGRARAVDSSRTGKTERISVNASHQRCKIGDGDYPQVQSCSSLDKKVKAQNNHEMPTSSYKSSARDHQERVKSRRRSSRSSSSSSGLLSTMGNSAGSLGSKGRSLMVRDKETEKRAAGEIHAAVDKLNGEDRTVGDSNASLTCDRHHQVSNIVLLRSSKHSTLDDKVKVTRDAINSSLELRSQVPRSCPLSLDLERDSDEDMMLLPLLSAEKERFSGETRHSNTASSRMFDQEIQQDKKRDPSPSKKRFSFSFGRLSRSFTFKQDSSATDDTIKSDSMRFDGLACQSQSSNTEEEEEEDTHGGSRVSPLRRLLLDPLLKSKVSENVLFPSKARSTSFNQDEKKKKQDDASSRTRALLQLTIRNDGIPLFQFVVDDDDNLNKSRSILGATMKSSASSFKDDDSVQYCTFYSVNEVKKQKSGSWLIREKQQQQQDRFLYTVMGEMRLCNSSMNSDISSSVIRESVLVDETEQVKKGRKEVAAVVIKKTKKHNLTTLGGETTVIIPGGVHSIPEKGGAPTPLISKWRSGGSCDCGGWDVGCKLHVLTFLHEFDHSFQLFHQEESDRSSGPVLAMRELKTGGMYRVEFGSFLSHLQAFFVCVTVITSASEEETVSKTTGKSSSPFAPPLSPVGRA